MNKYTLQDDPDVTYESVAIPDVDQEPHLLISQVRTHYMEYIIKLLSVNYETNQRLLNKNITLPSAIWRCAKNIEMTAASNCMIVQLYRKNIVAVIKELKQDTKNGKMFKNLHDYVNKPPENDKKIQTSIGKANDCNCQCVCSKRKKRRKGSKSLKDCRTECVNATADYNIDGSIKIGLNSLNSTSDLPMTESVAEIKEQDITTKTLPVESIPKLPVQTQDYDAIMKQLEMLFQEDCNDDDLDEQSLCSGPNPSLNVLNTNSSPKGNIEITADCSNINITSDSCKEPFIDKHIAPLARQLMDPNESVITKAVNQKNRRSNSNKWLCEEYFLKSQLFEMLNQLRDHNKAKFEKVKDLLLDLFGDDSDDEDMTLPLDESPEFIISCTERIAPWVVKFLSPLYIKGNIKGKALFKSLAKHLIRLIYKCRRYPNEFEVKDFVSDFLENHQMIRCEADFKQFQINNLSHKAEELE